MQDTIETIDVAAACAVVAADIATRLGFKVDPQPTDISRGREESYATLDIEQTHGIFAMIVLNSELQLRMAPVEDGTTCVMVSLRYNHQGGGRNGFSIGTWWLKDGEVAHFRGNAS